MIKAEKMKRKNKDFNRKIFVGGRFVDDVAYNTHCRSMQHLDLSKVFAKEAVEIDNRTFAGKAFDAILFSGR